MLPHHCRNLSSFFLIVLVCLSSRRRYHQLKQQYELKVEEEQILQAKVQQSSFHQQQEELDRLRKAIGQTQHSLFTPWEHVVVVVVVYIGLLCFHRLQTSAAGQ